MPRDKYTVIQVKKVNLIKRDATQENSITLEGSN